MRDIYNNNHNNNNYVTAHVVSATLLQCVLAAFACVSVMFYVI